MKRQLFSIFRSPYSVVLLLGLLPLDRVIKHFLFTRGLYEINTGVSFSLFSDSSVVYLVHILALVILTSYFLILNRRAKKNVISVFMILIILAGLNNFVDRILYGGVVDYLNFYFFKNNLSDVVLTISSLYLVFFGIKTAK